MIWPFKRGEKKAIREGTRMLKGRFPVKDVLTKSALHPNEIKLRLESGVVGRVKKLDL